MEIERSATAKRVVIVDDDRDIAEVVQAILIDEGFLVSCLYEPDAAALSEAIDRLQPHCVLLDGGGSASYGVAWDVAKWLSTRPHPIPTVMFTGHLAERDEALLDESERARSAHFAATIPKPFDIDRLVAVVRRALGEGVRQSDTVESSRLVGLLQRIRDAGAEEVRVSSSGREWAMFRPRSGEPLYKVYRWRAADVYFVGRYAADGTQLEPLGQFYDLDALIAYCVGEIQNAAV